jgi:hypothetical protein
MVSVPKPSVPVGVERQTRPRVWRERKALVWRRAAIPTGAGGWGGGETTMFRQI